MTPKRFDFDTVAQSNVPFAFLFNKHFFVAYSRLNYDITSWFEPTKMNYIYECVEKRKNNTRKLFIQEKKNQRMEIS